MPTYGQVLVKRISGSGAIWSPDKTTTVSGTDYSVGADKVQPPQGFLVAGAQYLITGIQIPDGIKWQSPPVVYDANESEPPTIHMFH